MLFTIGLLLLLTPLPSFQATTSLKRDPGSDVSKADAVFTLSKPKPTAALSKQTVRFTPKPNAVSLTVLSAPVINQKPSAVNTTLTAKSKLNPAVTQTTPSPAVKATTSSGSTTIKDKPTGPVNRTVETKSPSISDVKNSKDKPSSSRVQTLLSTPAKAVKAISAADDKDKLTVSANQTTVTKAQSSSSKTIKTKLHPLANQTVSAKSPSGTGVRDNKDKPAPTGVPDVPATPTKSVTVSGVITAKEKHQPLVNETVSVKPPSGSEVRTSKDKPAPTVAPDVQSTLTKSASVAVVKSIKDQAQPSTNDTVLVKLAGDSKDKPAPKGTADVHSNQMPTKSLSASAPKTPKEKLHPVLNQTVSGKSHSVSEGRPSKDKPAPTGVSDVQAKPTKSVSAAVDKSIKDQAQPSTNDTVSGKSPSASDVKGSKNKPLPTGAPDVQATSTKSTSKPSKDKLQPSTNETLSVKSPSASDVKNNENKPAPTGAPESTSPKSASASAKVVKEKPSVKVHSSSEVSLEEPNKNRSTVNQTHVGNSENATGLLTPASANHTTAVKPPTTTKDSSSPLQPINVVISNGCESSNAKQHELQLQPGAPLVMTHKISLLPGGCTGECESEMAALTRRVARLEKEMSLLKEKCPCSGNCPDDCSGNGKCEKGKCICHQGFLGPDCKAVKTKETAETTSKQVNKNKEGVPEKTTKVEHTGVSTTSKPAKSNPQQREEGNKEEARGGKTTVVNSNDLKKDDDRILPDSKSKHNELKDQPHANETQSNDRKPKDAVKTVPGTNRTGKEQWIQTEKNITQLPEHKSNKTETGKEKVQTGGSGLGSVKIVNVSSHSFTLTWLAPPGMFKNFTVIRTEQQLEGGDDAHEKFREHQTSRAKNATEVRVQTESTRTVTSRGKPDTKRISIVLPGSVRSVEFSNLRANTRYALQIYGTGAEKRSKIHRVTAVTGPESATDIVFSNVTESSLTVSWSKPKSTYTGFKVTYTNAVTGESRSVTVGSRQTHLVLTKLSAGSTYTVAVMTTLGRAQSSALTSVMTTVPAPPTHLQVVNVTDNRAGLHWTPSLGKVDRFVITYESSKTPNVTVTVTVPGSSANHQLRGLQRGTVYTLRVLSQKGSLQSTAVSATFTTANVVKASEVGPRYAVITWKTPTVVYHSYRVTYQVAGEEKKEVTLEPSITQYKLTGLLPMSRYAVLVQGEREGHYTSLVTADFTTGKLRFPFPSECSQELLNGALQSGEVDIHPQGKEGPAVRVYCDMETDGGGWTVFQRRTNGKTDFYRNWSDYRAGFGKLSEEFWLGNDLLRNLTSVGPVSLRVDMRSGNDTAYAHYTNFSIDSEKRHYALTVSGYSGTAGDSMKYHNGRPFSTWDKDPQSLGIHCAKAYTGGWWYKNCYKTNLNGRYGTNSNNQGIVWIDWKGKDFSIPFTEMKFRPSAFSPVTHG